MHNIIYLQRNPLEMNVGNIKGALLEYILRQLLKNCGFTNVVADNVYTFENSGLFFVNGKGAAHDADIIMNPPIQIPFSYPTLVIFECKAYSGSASLPIVRNAAGLRQDLNDFEIVTLESIEKRKNNRLAEYAIEMRRRYTIQVGVASINDFTKPAVEFAANNKIPLFSLSWFLGEGIINNINSLDTNALINLGNDTLSNFYSFLKDRNGDINHPDYSLTNVLLNGENVFGNIVTFSNTAINRSYVGLLETGDLLFLFLNSQYNIFTDRPNTNNLKAEIHWWGNRPNVWILTVFENGNRDIYSEYKFFLPQRLLRNWTNFNREQALRMKEQFFSKIFVFNRSMMQPLPFTLITIDTNWLERAMNELRNE